MCIQLLLQSFYKIVCNKWNTGNIYDSRSLDPLIIRREILSTRLYIVLVIISLITLTIYSSLSNRTENKTVILPSQSIYENLQNKYATSLQCSCTKISIPYGDFVKIVPLFHQVCSSDFISQQWINFIFQANSTFIWPIDVRTSLSAMWQLIRTFCQSSINMTTDALNQFNNSPLINTMLLTEELLEAKVQAALYLLRQTASATLIQPMTIVHKVTQANQLVTGLLTNYVAVTKSFGLAQRFIPYHDIGYMNISLYTGTFGNKYISKNSSLVCSCQNNGSCPLPGNLYLYKIFETFGMYDLNRIKANETLSGIIIDCLPSQMTLSSSLECFYNQSCLNILLLSYNDSLNISILNQSLSSRFISTTKIQLLINELFLEEMFNQTNYTKYYSQCLPNVCQYIYIHRFYWINVLTIFIGLLGGITTVLHIITPYIIRLILCIKKRCVSKKYEQVREKTPFRPKELFLKVKGKIITFNLYSKYSRDPIRVYHGVLATRLYIILLLISICIIILFSYSSNQVFNEIIINPSEQEYGKLEEKYSLTLTCPCTQISIPYEDLITIEVKYHQICTSDFIQPWWYQSFLPYNTSDNNKIDFLSFAPSYFQTLETFCDIAKIIINNEINRFLTTTFVHAQILTNDLFYSQINSSINTFIQLTKNEYLYRMSLTNELLHSNQYLSHMMASTSLEASLYAPSDGLATIEIIADALYTLNASGDTCYCVLDSTCNIDDILFISDGDGWLVDWQLNGIRGGCSVKDSVLKSSLVCWFENTCLNQLRMLVNTAKLPILPSIIPLDSTLSSQYFPNTSTELIFNEIMIEEWNYSSPYSTYYQKCKPSFCSFTYKKKTSIIYIITIIISLIGGINVILRLFSPFIIKIIFKCIHRLKRKNSPQISTIQEENHQNVGICNGIRNRMIQIIDKFLMINLFDSESDNIETMRLERVSTKIYLLIFSICIYSITIYIIFTDTIIDQSFSNPSENDYNNLLISHSKSLDCPCNKISIAYKDFIEINTTFHQICSSDFVNIKWINYLFHEGYWYDYERRDIRVRGSAYFLFLSSLCSISQTTINNAIEQFLNEIFINTKLISEPEFNIQIENIILQFRNETLTKFSGSLKLLRDIMNGNAFVSSYFLNWYWWRDVNSTSSIIPISPIIMENGCSCGTQSDCIDSGGIYYILNNIQKFAMSGWNIGCSVVETLLYSTFECLYNQTCIDLLLHYATSVSSLYSYGMNISAINSSIVSRFKRNALTQTIADELFIEEWKVNSSYSLFYNQCAPAYCSYKIQKDDYAIYIISKILGLYGGLTVSLRFIIPIITKIIFNIIKRWRNNIIIPN
ncbi:unnamed protein product [Adineta steineri]|uniref:Uncharacterized protein n=1 Tax=Adineta steineri TaxID=433720 RepID=A0A818WNW1_9BILA|nr:unnamed protein product [Adineta steineri]